MRNALRNLLEHDGYRPKEIEDSITLRVLSFFTVTVAIAATVHATESALSIGVSAVLISALGFLLSWKRRRAKNWWIKIILALMMFVALANFFLGIRENPYDARIPLAHLLIWLQTLHSFDLPRRKDVFYSLWVGLILISVAATTSRSTIFGAYLAVYALLAVASLLASHLSSQKASPRLLKRLSLPVLLGGAVLGSVVFLALPRYEGMKIRTFPVSMQIKNLPQFDGKIKNPSYDQNNQGKGIGDDAGGERKEFDPFAYYGFSTQLDLNYRGRLSDEVVMKVRGSRASYWRGMGFDTYDGLGWTMTEPYSLERLSRSRQPLWIRESRQIKNNIAPREQVTHSFYIERDQSNLIFKAPYAEQLYFPTDYVLFDKYGGLRSPIQLFSGTTYTVISSVPSFSPDRLRTISWQDMKAKPSSDNYYQVPEKLPQRVKDLAQQLTAEAQGPFDAIKALEKHLKSQYPYNLDIPEFPEDRDSIDYFLFEQKEGYCEHFATSLAMMARTLGIPTRLATGYTPGEYNPLTGYFEVRSSDAHAWVEAYFPHHGWVPFDPTPGYLANLSPDNKNDKSTLGNFGDYFAQWIPKGLKDAFRRALELTLGGLLAGFGAVVGLFTLLPLPVMLLAVGGVIALLLLVVFGLSRRRKVSETAAEFSPRYRDSLQRERFVRLFLDGLGRLQTAYGTQGPEGGEVPFLTPVEQATLLSEYLNQTQQTQMQHWIQLYQATRYGEQLPSASDIEQLQAFFKVLVQEAVAERV